VPNKRKLNHCRRTSFSWGGFGENEAALYECGNSVALPGIAAARLLTVQRRATVMDRSLNAAHQNTRRKEEARITDPGFLNIRLELGFASF
jgi:hypothetical protein